MLAKANRPLAKVNLRLSQPINASLPINRNFRLTETNDAEEGIYTIYLSRTPRDYAFYGQLAHEVAHLMYPNVHDAYMEGLCTVFAEKYLEAQGKSWNGWRKYFQAGHEPLYAKTYFMMRKVWDIVGNEAIGRLENYIVTDNNTGENHFDIAQWILSLPLAQQSSVKEVIAQYALDIQLALNKETHHPVSFYIP